MNIIDIELGEFAKNFRNYIDKKQTYISYNNKYYALRGVMDTVNEDACERLNVEIINTNHLGGTIVLNPNSIGFARISNDLENKFSNAFINAFVAYLQSCGLDADFIDNDIMVDGKYKVAAVSKSPLNQGLTYFAMIISFDVNIEYIEQISQKPINKTPKGLNDYSILAEDVRQFIKNYIEVFDDVFD